MSRLLQDYRKATLTCYNQGMQNSISKHTICQSFQQMGYSSRRLQLMLLLLAKNKKLSKKYAQFDNIGHQKSVKMLPDLMSPNFCCHIQMVRSEFGGKNMRVWIFHVLY